MYQLTYWKMHCSFKYWIFLYSLTPQISWLNLILSIPQIKGANFPDLQPMAELQRNQRGEIGCQHVKVHSCSHFSPCFDHTSPTETDDGTSQIDRDTGAYVPYSFRPMSRVLLRPLPTKVQGWRRQGQWLNITTQWRDHLNWERGFTAC